VRRDAAILLACAALLLLPGLSRLRAVENTDARYLEISRAMYVSGDWLVPRLAGRPHLDKPPLTYWAASLGYAGLGVTPFAGRLLQQLVLAGTALLLAGAGRRWFGREGAFGAALVLLTSALVFASSRILATDLFQLLFFSAAMLAFLRGVERPGRPAALVLAFLLLGLSMNAKGPIALFVAACVWLPFLVLTRGRVTVSKRAVALGLAGFVLVGAPWYVALASREPDVLRFWTETQLLGRLTGSGENIRHEHGPFYLLLAWPMALLPWTPLAWLALWRLRPRAGWRRADPIDLYLLLWAVVPVIFFSIPGSKIATYLLPALPGAAFAMARAYDQGLLADRTARRALAGCLALGSALALVILLALSQPTWLGSVRFETDRLIARWPSVVALALVASAMGWGAGRLARGAGSLQRGILGTALGAGLVCVLGFNAVAPAFSSWRDEGLLARSVPDAWLFEYGVTKLSALYYFGNADRFVRSRSLAAEERRGPISDEDGATIPAKEGITLLRSEQPVFCLTELDLAPELIERSGAVVVHERLGTVLLANPRAAATLLARQERGAR
jgi:4-amino-4-deoxy-L-arabinose transferase-like glycosyltransferase